MSELKQRSSKPSASNDQEPNKARSPVTAPKRQQVIVPTYVMVKLLAFSAALLILPISAYFVTLNNLFKGESFYAAAVAVAIANLVVFAYIFAAFIEDSNLQEEEQQLNKKKT